MLIGNFYGTEAFAAYNVGVNMLNIGMVVGFGFSIAGATLVGQNLGAGDFDQATRSGWRACILAMVSMAVLAVLTAMMAEPFARFFLGDDDITVQRTVEFTYILAAMLPLLGIEVAIGGSLRGAGDTRFPLLTTFIGLIGMRCGLAALFTFMGMPVIWVYGAIIGDYVVKSVLLVWRFHSGRWKTLISNESLNLPPT
jgi:Na+-driven multidrug efflux pump